MPETIWTRPQYTPGEPHGSVDEVVTVEEVTDTVVLVRVVVANTVELEAIAVDEASEV